MTAQPETLYGADDLTHLEGLDAVRKRPGMYIGSTDSRGVGHLVNEILDNSTDEGVAGHATRVAVTLHADGSVQVDDDGRGIPTDINAKSGLNGVEPLEVGEIIGAVQKVRLRRHEIRAVMRIALS